MCLVLFLGVEKILRRHRQTFRDDKTAQVFAVDRTANQKTCVPVFATAGTFGFAGLKDISHEIPGRLSTRPSSVLRSALLTKFWRVDPDQSKARGAQRKRVSVNRNKSTGELPIIEAIHLRQNQSAQEDEQKQDEAVLYRRKPPA